MTVSRLLFYFFVFLASAARAQDSAYAADMAFARHLEQQQLYKDAALHFRQLQHSYALSPAQRDSISYRLGESFEKTGQRDSAASAYGRVSPGSPVYAKAVCGKALMELQQENFGALSRTLSAVPLSDTATRALRLYGLPAAALLRNDTGLFRQTMQQQTPAAYDQANGEYSRLLLQDQRLRGIKKKSPFVAGALSALVPGLGKVYAGKPRHGLAAFTPVAILGVQAFEAYRKGGIKDARFIGYASLFSVFYLGNIYGSALTVRVQRRETINDVHYVVQADLSFALQRLRR